MGLIGLLPFGRSGLCNGCSLNTWCWSSLINIFWEISNNSIKILRILGMVLRQQLLWKTSFAPVLMRWYKYSLYFYLYLTSFKATMFSLASILEKSLICLGPSHLVIAINQEIFGFLEIWIEGEIFRKMIVNHEYK